MSGLKRNPGGIPWIKNSQIRLLEEGNEKNSGGGCDGCGGGDEVDDKYCIIFIIQIQKIKRRK